METDLTRANTVLDFEKQEVLDQLRDREADVQRHTLWAVVGVSPGALIPLVVSMSQLGASVLLGSVVLMTGVEAWRALRAKRDVAELKEVLETLPPG